MNDESDNVVHVEFGGGAPTTHLTSFDLRVCKHTRIDIDVEKRAVICKTCDAQLNPFDFLAQYANRERRYRNWEAAEKQARTKLRELKDEIRKAKARLRSANRQHPDAAAAAVRARDDLARRRIQTSAADIVALAQRIAATCAGGVQPKNEGGRLTRFDCPKCGKGHCDEGEWATRRHKTHRCVDDAFGKGCGHEWRLPGSGYWSGAPPTTPRTLVITDQECPV